MDHREKALAYLQEQQKQHLSDLKKWVSIPSVSTDPTAKAFILQAAEQVKSDLLKIGIEQVEIMPTLGHPVVYGIHKKAGPAAPTMLVYGHYDVQPAEPLELWHSDPYKPEIRQEYMYGRGVTDMKGQVLAAMNAVEAVLKTGSSPINLVFLIEGEEEIGSPNLGAFLEQHKELFQSDFALNPDAGTLGPDLPTITYGLRGMAYFDLKVFGPDHDLHSGVFGGVVHNPAQALCELIAGMHEANGFINLPGFYDTVQSISAEEQNELSCIPHNEDFFLENTGVPELWGDPAYSPFERTTIRPTLEVHGLYSGFIGEGGKTVLPAYAKAKISMRLVPDQNPEAVHQQLLAYLETHAPATIRYEVSPLGGSRASINRRDTPGIVALSDAMQTVWGKKPIFRREGGSVPVVGLFQDILGIESVNTGFSMESDNMHGPDERMHLPTWHKGTQVFTHFIFNLNKG